MLSQKPNTIETPKSPPNETELLSLYRQTGELSYIGELYKKFTPLVYGVCMKYLQNPEDSQDAVMQIFEKLLAESPTHHINNWSAWLYVVARNHCLMVLRKKKLPTMGLEKRNLENRMELSENLHLTDELEPENQRLHKALELPSEQETCMRLFFFEEKTYKEIVELTGYEMQKVKSHLQNGKRMLKILMEQK